MYARPGTHTHTKYEDVAKHQVKSTPNQQLKYTDRVNLGVSLCLTAGVLGHLFAQGILTHKF